MLFNQEREIFFHSASVLIGTIVGVGVFGIPFSFAKAGFLAGFLFLVLTGALTFLINLIFGEIVLRTEKMHQFTGYVEVYLGQAAKKIASFAWFSSIYGALLAYIIISGSFLFSLFISWFYAGPFFYSVLFFILAAVASLAGLKTFAWLEFVMVLFFTAAVFLIFIFGFPSINFDNFKPLLEGKFWFLPYGVLLFAFAGFSAVPLQRELVKGRPGILKKSIALGTLIPAVLYLLFSFSIVGIAGESVSPDAVTGLIEFLDYRIIFIVSLFGLFAIATSFLGLSAALMETLRLDYGFKKIKSWALAAFIPFLMFLFGVRNFIEVISIAGSIAIGIEGIILVIMYKKAKKKGDRQPEYSLKIPVWVLNLTVILFALGALYALFF